MRYLVFIVLMIAACNEQQESSKVPVDIQAIKLTTLAGESIGFDQYKGKTVFVNFWATWCKPCVEEMPSIKNVMDSLKKEKIEFLFATDDSSDDIEAFDSIHHFGFNYVKAISLHALNVIVLPTTFIFDKNGKQVFSETGYRKWNDKPNLDLLLKIINQQ